MLKHNTEENPSLIYLLEDQTGIQWQAAYTERIPHNLELFIC